MKNQKFCGTIEGHAKGCGFLDGTGHAASLNNGFSDGTGFGEARCGITYDDGRTEGLANPIGLDSGYGYGFGYKYPKVNIELFDYLPYKICL